MNERNYDRSFKKSQWTLVGAFDTTATELLDEALEVVLAVVVGDFLPLFDIPLGHDKDSTATVESLTVRPAGVVSVARGVVARTAVDIPAGIHIKHVAVVPLIPHRGRDPFADVLDNGRPLLDRGDGKEAETGATALDDYVGRR